LFRVARSNRRTSAGFTIIEVLVALAVVASGLAAIATLIGTSHRGARALEQHIALVETARAIVAGLPGRADLTLGEFTGEAGGHRWRVDVLPSSTERPAGAPPGRWEPRRVVVTVRSPSGAVLRINTIRLVRRPAE
jgi:general secretion pathway protein I